MQKQTTPPLLEGDGQQLRAMLEAATAWLEKNAKAVDALNVFPVPDGDTGTNMLLTMRSAMAQARACDSSHAGTVGQAIAQGALLGARGNSGVILSQILRGLCSAFAEKERFGAPDFAAGLICAADLAYKAVITPVEGTLLTVIRETSTAVHPTAHTSLAASMTQALQAAEASVRRTPDLLPVLKEAGVVDAGGQGLVLLLEGALAQLEGRELGPERGSLGEIAPAWLQTAASGHGEHEPDAWGFCTQFVLKELQRDPEQLRADMATMGSSVLVVGDAQAVQVHIHTPDPGPALSYALTVGSLHNIKIDNMADQHAALLASRPTTAATTRALPVVAVAPGPGLAEVFSSLGAGKIVSGGQSMNPSAAEILAAVDALPGEAAVLLPNNPNVVLVCLQLQQLTPRRIAVIPTKTAPQGIAALMAANPERDFEANVAAMTEASETVHTIEIAAASRDATVDGQPVRAGQYLALLDRELAAVDDDAAVALNASLDKLAAAPGYLLTLYHGQDLPPEAAAAVAEQLRARADGPEVELVWGGQPHYPYIVSVEA